jgi:hypothetical protein
MEFEEIINQQRESYLIQLISFYKDRTEGAKEILIKLNGEDEDLLFNLNRFDYLVKIDGKFNIEELSPDSYKNHLPITFSYEQLHIELHPFFWHGYEFIIDQEYNDFDWLRSWTKTYIDEEGVLENEDDGFTQAIHSVSFPIAEQNRIKFTVDFGTASKDTFMNLINTIKNTGAKQLTINSFDMINEC